MTDDILRAATSDEAKVHRAELGELKEAAVEAAFNDMRVHQGTIGNAAGLCFIGTTGADCSIGVATALGLPFAIVAVG